MKKLLLIFILLFSTLMFSTPSYGEWTKVGENVGGSIYYIDFERIRKHDGNVYFWYLTDYLKPIPGGSLSDKTYVESNCKFFRYRWLSINFFSESMGKGTVDLQEPIAKHKGWKYPPPDSVIETVLKAVCNH